MKYFAILVALLAAMTASAQNVQKPRLHVLEQDVRLGATELGADFEVALGARVDVVEFADHSIISSASGWSGRPPRRGGRRAPSSRRARWPDSPAHPRGAWRARRRR